MGVQMSAENPKTMRAWVVRSPGPIETEPLSVEERPVPGPR